MSLTLSLLGGVSLESGGAPLTGGAVQRHRLALLALLATSRGRATTRDKAMGLLWPEREEARARALLNQAVHVLRQALGAAAIRSTGEELQLDTDLVSCDVVRFEEALAAGQPERAVSCYAGPFVDGFFLAEAEEFERWTARERARLAAAYAAALETLAERATLAGDARGAVEWWTRRVAHDPADSRAVACLMDALEAAGHRAAALRAAEAHEALLRADFGIVAPAEVQQRASRLRLAAMPGDDPARTAPARPADAPAGVAAAPTTSEPPRDASDSPRVGHAHAGVAPLGARRVFAGVVPALAGAAVLVLIALSLRSDRADAGATGAPGVSADEIADAVARELERRARGDTAPRDPALRTRNLAAYEEYLRGSDPVLLRDDGTARVALRHLERAVALDPGYAAAWAGVARLTLRTGLRGTSSPLEARRRAEAAARRALAIDDDLAEAHGALALVQISGHDLAAAEASLARALALDPAEVSYRDWRTKLHLWQGRDREALAEAQRAYDDAPVSPTAVAELARALLANGRETEALARLDALADLRPPLARVAGIAALCHARAARWDEALATIREQARAGVPLAIGLEGYLLARAGRRADAEAVLARVEASIPRDAAEAVSAGLIRLALEDVDAGMRWLEQAADAGTLSAMHAHALAVRWELEAHPDHAGVARLRSRLGLVGRPRRQPGT